MGKHVVLRLSLRSFYALAYSVGAIVFLELPAADGQESYALMRTLQSHTQQKPDYRALVASLTVREQESLHQAVREVLQGGNVSEQELDALQEYLVQEFGPDLPLLDGALHTFRALDNCSDICELSSLVDEFAQMTTSQLDVIEGNEVTIYGTLLCVNALACEIESMVTVIDSKIDLIDGGACCSLIEVLNSTVDSLSEIVGDFTDTSTNLDCFNTVSAIDNADLTVISWLKTIARELAGLTTCNC